LSYKYDIFISYPRLDPIGPWVADVFGRQLQRWLPAEIGERKVFRDVAALKPGQPWPEHLQVALQRSRLMIAIWSPPYFTSEWCMAELTTMRAREHALGLAPDDPNRLIYPIRFSDGAYFDQRAQACTCHDFNRYSSLHPNNEGTLDFREMVEEVRDLCRSIGERLKDCPPWSPDWPLLVAPPLRPRHTMPPPGFK